MRFDRDVYFGVVREVLFEGALTQQNVDGQNVILGLWETQLTGSPMNDIRWLAYMLATTSDVSPDFAMPDLVDELPAYAMSGGEDAPAFIAFTNGQRDGCRDLVAGMGFADAGTTTAHHVGGVVSFGSEKQMGFIAARGVVA